MIFTAGMLTFVKAFLEDSLAGTRSLRDRESALTVGRFPWVLTRFTGYELEKKSLSLLSRASLSFHPAIYLFVPGEAMAWYDWILGAFILGFSCWIFFLSEQFQRPVLFDSKTELYRKRDLNALTGRLERLLDELQKSDNHKKKKLPDQAPQLNSRHHKKIQDTLGPPKEQVSTAK